MSIRPIRRSELDALVRLCAEHAEYEKACFDENGQAERLGRHLFVGPVRLFVWVVELENSLEGFAAVSLEYSTWRARDYLHLDCLYLRQQARGQGWGSGLLRTAIEHGQKLGCDQMQWQTPPWNEKAIDFYDRRGARGAPKIRYSLALDPPVEGSRRIPQSF